MQQLVLVEILAVPAEQSRGRHNPRAVKRKMSSFPTKARAAPSARQVIRYPDCIRIIPPAANQPHQAGPQPRTSPPAPVQPSQQASWRDHVRAWRKSGLKRTDYAQRHGRKLCTLNQWIARLRHTFRRRCKAAPSHA